METTFFNLTNCLILSFILFGIGCFGVIARRNILIILMSIEIMLNAVNLSFLSFNYFLHFIGGEKAHYFVLLIIAVAAAEAAVGLALLVTIYRNKKNTDSNSLEIMKG